jgi:hypothetical protein
MVHKVDALTSQAQAAQAAKFHSETATAAQSSSKGVLEVDEQYFACLLTF